MDKPSRSLTVAGAMFVSLLCVGSARAELPVTWVSGTGDDLHTCGRLDPCRTLQAALSKTMAGGEIRALTAGFPPGQFGSVIIDKSVSIVGDSVQVGWTPANTAVIEISAGKDDVVSLRGLVIDGVGNGIYGIWFKSGAALHIQNCVVRAFNGSLNGQGIVFGPSGKSSVYISDTLIADNGVIPALNSWRPGILVSTFTGGSANVVLDRVKIKRNGIGIIVFSASPPSGPVNVLMRNSTVAGNGTGILVHGVASGAADVVIDRSDIVGNGDVGIESYNQTTVHVGNSTVTGHTTGLRSLFGGVLDLRPNNTIVGNVTNIDEPPPGL